MFEGIVSECIGGAILVLLVQLTNSLRPIVWRYLSAWWRSHGPGIAAGFASVWRKALLVALTLAWSAGGVLAYGLTGGMEDAAPLWAMCWLGSVSLAVWGCAAWQGGLAVRWAGRQTRRLLA
jgi:hypothetical protein